MRLVVPLVFVACAAAPPPPPPAKPPPPPPPPVVPVALVDLDCEDATEDQADALTAALRMRVSAGSRWHLGTSRPSMTALIPALSCPRPPDSACLERISQQLEVDHYFWGTVKMASLPDSVVAEVHYYGRGEPEHVARETYSSNLTDQNDDALRRIASQLIEQLTRQTTP